MSYLISKENKKKVQFTPCEEDFSPWSYTFDEMNQILRIEVQNAMKWPHDSDITELSDKYIINLKRQF